MRRMRNSKRRIEEEKLEEENENVENSKRRMNEELEEEENRRGRTRRGE